MTHGDVKTADKEIEAMLASLPPSFVVGQVGQSLDGRIATPTGHSHYINGLAARQFLHRLRACVDAVVIGVGTALADQPQLTVRHVRGQDPARVVLDPKARVNLDNPVLIDDGTPVVVCVGAGQSTANWPPHISVLHLPLTDQGFEPERVRAALQRVGFDRLLVEGGPTTLSRFIHRGVLDRLYCMIAPLIIGSGPAGIQLPAIDHLDQAIRSPTRSIDLEGEWLVEVMLKHQTR